MKVFVYSARPYDEPVLQLAAKEKQQLFFTEKTLDRQTARLAKGCDAVSLFTSDDASAPVLEELHAQGVKYVLLRSVGYDHIDLNKANTLGIRAANVPEYSPYSVAEHAVAMLMALNRNIVESQRLLELQDFRIDSLMGFDIHGKTVGIIGTGKIGIALARIMLGFGARVIAYDPQVNAEALGLRIDYVNLKEVLSSSDVISLHCPLNTATKHLIGKAEFEMMKRSSILINTSRGAIINTYDLIDALANQKIGGACLDVYEFEKGLFFQDHRRVLLQDLNFVKLRAFKNVLLTCHQGFLTSDALTQIAETTVHNIECFEKGISCANELFEKA
jgi:D-lactate dehydrogenase